MSWMLAALFGLAVAAVAMAAASVVLCLLYRRMAGECRGLRADLNTLMEQSQHWPGRAAALYPSLADLIDDKLSGIPRRKNRRRRRHPDWNHAKSIYDSGR
ncbi:MAG: hypothetical protein FJZ93_09195 [Chloroflexi bacterium]|nr:hypothetical protein [Chloroflexota bacterium]